MNNVVVCHPKLAESQFCKFFTKLKLRDENLIIGVLDVPITLDIKDIPDNFVLVKIKAFSCNYRDEALILNTYKKYINIENGNFFFYLPLGSEFVGGIIHVGKSVSNLSVGDRVIPNCSYPLREEGKLGGIPSNYASQRLQIFHYSQLLKVPEEMPDEQAAAFSISAQTAYSIVRKLCLNCGENVLITAATSNTSLTIIKVLSKLNVNIYACTFSKKYIDNLLKLGVKFVYSYHSFEKEISLNNIRFDAIIDPFEDIYFEKVVNYLGIGGKYITCGFFINI